MKQRGKFKIIENREELEIYCKKHDGNGFDLRYVIVDFKLDFSNQEVASFSAHKCIFLHDVIFVKSHVVETFVVEESNFKGQFSLKGAIFEDVFQIFHLRGSACISNVLFKGHFVIECIHESKKSKGLILVYNSTFEDVAYFISSYHGKIKSKALSNNNMGHIWIEKCDFKGSFSLTTFLPIEFKAESTVFHRSISLDGTINELSLNGTMIEAYLKIGSKLEIIKASRGDFNLLKHTLIKSNNQIDALKYHRREMQIYFEEQISGWALSKDVNIGYIKNYFKSILFRKRDNKSYSFVRVLRMIFNKFPYRNVDFYVLLAQKCSNDYGLKWNRGVIFTLVSALIFFMLYTTTLQNPLFVWGWESWSSFINVLKISIPYYTEFLYAAHRFDFMEKYQPNFIGSSIDFVGRIFIGFGYYQTISAFRKFGKL